MRENSLKHQIIFWALTFAGLVAFLWVFQPVLLPFILGVAVAYLLNPVVNALGRCGLPRFWGTISVLSSFLLATGLLLLVTLPIITRELNELIQRIPAYMAELETILAPYIEDIKNGVENAEKEQIQSFIGQHAASASEIGKGVLQSLAAGGAFLGSLMSVLVLAPVVSFFMLNEWPSITTWAEDLIPRHYKKTALGLLGQIDKKVAGFVRGQLMVAFTLGTVYALALFIAGLNHGVLIGLIAGLLSIIPMLGSIAGLLIAVLVAWFQSGEWQFTLIIAGIFVAGQLIEGNILTPKLVGNSIGMHPLWIFFALMAGGALAGIVGMLVAVPLAASLGVLANFGIQQYKASALYTGAAK